MSSTQRREKGSSISRVLEIIEAVSKSEHPLSAADLSVILDIPKPSIHRLLQQLESDGFLQTNMRGLLVPAERLHTIALGVLYASRYKAQRQAILKKLAEQVGETCGISIPNGIDMIYYDRAQTNWPLQIHLPVGIHTPVNCTASGKLYLSSLNKERRHRIISTLPTHQYARNTYTNADQLEQALIKIKDTGVGTDNEEFLDGMVAISVAIKDQQGRLIACLFCHAPVIRKSLDELLSYIPFLTAAAKELGNLAEEED
ncbi:IclR family transcriptional regulator [Marinomonas rhizomae]|uniref:HTH-type transcriptional repressor AllR n=1 Tax=Marinomonas rhizomae TaxID=491948 RepID=A0A366J9C6_9GAMM|nr:IclR family transcriptional regulator [Marinomonas rhizomae]RBP83542.1 IclR family transcriptional regulator [Marinomonas rhizomae]RNF74091.1 IclR family transcriptional regulator [Marinomonas rhizomae]